MNDDSKWKRKLPGRIYDYNYKVSEAYYQPQTDYIDTRSPLRKLDAPPDHQSYAERFSNKPWYGGTRGLPYNDTDAEIYKPLVNRRATSASRASSIIRDRTDHSDIPQSVRTARRRRRREEDLEDDEPITFKPIKKYNFEDDFDIPHKKIDIKEELRKLDEVKYPSTIPKTSSRKYEHSIWNDDLKIPGKKSVSKEEVSYTLPSTGTKVHKSSYSETKKYESSKPPIGVRSRHIGFTSDDPTPSFLRSRKVSLEDSGLCRLPPRSLRSQATSPEDSGVNEHFRPKAKELRNLQRSYESENLTDNIHKMVSKMRSHNIDPEEAYKYGKSIRASSLDPFGDDTKYQARHRAVRAHNFIYGVGKY